MNLFEHSHTHPPSTGKLLVSEPFLPDPNFNRTVVLLTEHQEEGSIGFVLNRPLQVSLGEVLDVDLELHIPIYMGGPVQQDTLHIIHKFGAIGEKELEIIDGVYWGADFDNIKSMLENNDLNLNNFRFFLGYSGWGKGQLDEELEQKSWIVTSCTSNIIFSKDAEELWKQVLKEMGGNLSFLANSPENPQLN